jgi:hypothetical protein
VFNFFRPGYVPPATSLGAGLVAPEFQLVNENSVGGYLNYMQIVIHNGLASADIQATYQTEMSLALSPSPANPTALVDRLNLLLCAGQISAANVQLIATTVGNMRGTDAKTPANTPLNLRFRVCAAVLMVMACAEYLLQK